VKESVNMQSYEELLSEIESIIEGTYEFKDEELDEEYIEKQRKEAEVFQVKSQKLAALSNYLSAKDSIEKLKSAKEKLN